MDYSKADQLVHGLLTHYLKMVLLVVVSAALPAYSQTLLVNLGVPQGAAPTLVNVVNIIVSVVISYPAMKFWIMPKHA